MLNFYTYKCVITTLFFIQLILFSTQSTGGTLSVATESWTSSLSPVIPVTDVKRMTTASVVMSCSFDKVDSVLVISTDRNRASIPCDGSTFTWVTSGQLFEKMTALRSSVKLLLANNTNNIPVTGWATFTLRENSNYKATPVTYDVVLKPSITCSSSYNDNIDFTLFPGDDIKKVINYGVSCTGTGTATLSLRPDKVANGRGVISNSDGDLIYYGIENSELNSNNEFLLNNNSSILEVKSKDNSLKPGIYNGTANLIMSVE